MDKSLSDYILCWKRERKRYMYKIDRRVIYYNMYEMMYPYFIENGYEADYKFSLLYAEDII